MLLLLPKTENQQQSSFCLQRGYSINEPVADVRIYHRNVSGPYTSENERRDRGREKRYLRKLTRAHARPPLGVGGCGEVCFPRERTRLALACIMNDGAPSHLLPDSERMMKNEDEDLCTRHGP